MLAFPIRSNRRVIGVVEFFAREDRAPDDDLLRTVGTLGNQIGEFIERAKAEEEVRVRDRALASSTNGIIITDAGQPDNPIVYVNPAFERLTGYSADEVVGRNCRFLQGPDTDPETIAQLHDAIEQRIDINVVILNYRKDGTPFWSDLTIAPVTRRSRQRHSFRRPAKRRHGPQARRRGTRWPRRKAPRSPARPRASSSPT